MSAARPLPPPSPSPSKSFPELEIDPVGCQREAGTVMPVTNLIRFQNVFMADIDGGRIKNFSIGQYGFLSARRW